MASAFPNIYKTIKDFEILQLRAKFETSIVITGNCDL